MHCFTAHHTTPHHTTLSFLNLHCFTAQHSAAQYSTAPFFNLHCFTAWDSTALICVAFVCRFKCWQAGAQSSPVDGQWYPKNISSTTVANPKARLSVHLKLPKTKLQWRLQEQLQQKLSEHPELADATQPRDPALARHLLQDQFALGSASLEQPELADSAQTAEQILAQQLLQEQSVLEQNTWDRTFAGRPKQHDAVNVIN